MKVYINERSVDRQAESHQEAMYILSSFAQMISKSRSIAYEGKAFRTRCFSQREIIKGVTVKDVLVSSVIKQSLSDEVARKLTLQTLMARPFAESFHLNENDFIRDESGACLKNSCFDDASESMSGSLMISAVKAANQSCELFNYTSSIFGGGFSLNVRSEKMLDDLTWIYESNPKHGLRPRQTEGVKISEMDLTHQQAQVVLNNAVKVNSKVFGYFDGCWYQ